MNFMYLPNINAVVAILLVAISTVNCNEYIAVDINPNSNSSQIVVPRALTSARNLDVSLISANLVIDNDRSQPMTINNGQATAEIIDLSDGSHEFNIVFSYASPKHGTVELANANKIFAISSQQLAINFTENDYEFADDDNDGFINITEVNNVDWDPNNSEIPGINDDNYELNDSQNSAYDLSNQEGISLKDQRGLGRHVDDDWFKIDLTAERPRIKIDIEAFSTSSIDTELVDSGGVTLSSAKNFGRNKHHDYIVPTAGEYFIRVFSFEPTDSEYDLIWSAEPAPVDDEYENNNSREQAFNLKEHQSDSLGGDGLSTISGLGIQSDDDWYLIEAVEGELQEVEVALEFVHSSGNIDLELFNVGGESLFSSKTNVQDNLPTGSEERILFHTRVDQDFYILVQGDNSGNPYDLSWNNKKSFNDEDFYDFSENNNSLESADIALRLYASDATNIISLANTWETGIQNDDDWFEIEVQGDKRTINLDLHTFETSNVLEMTLHDASGNLLATAQENGSLSNINTTVANEGKYFIRISGDNAGDIYNIVVFLTAEIEIIVF